MRIQSDSWPTNQPNKAQPSSAQPSPVWAHWPASNKFRLRPVTKIQLSSKLLSVYKIFKPLFLVCWWKFSVPKVNLPSWREKRGMKSCIDEYYYLLFQEALKRNLIFDIHKTAPLLRPRDRRVQSRWIVRTPAWKLCSVRVNFLANFPEQLVLADLRDPAGDRQVPGPGADGVSILHILLLLLVCLLVTLHLLAWARTQHGATAAMA